MSDYELMLEAGDRFCQAAVESLDLVAFFNKANPNVKFNYIDSSLVAYAQRMGVATNVLAVNIRSSRLCRDSRFQPIIQELGEEEEVKVSLAQIAQMLTAQGRGQSGRLLTNGYANLVPLGGGLYFVGYWAGGGWYCRVFPVSSASVWNAGRQILSRDSRAL